MKTATDPSSLIEKRLQKVADALNARKDGRRLFLGIALTAAAVALSAPQITEAVPLPAGFELGLLFVAGACFGAGLDAYLITKTLRPLLTPTEREA